MGFAQSAPFQPLPPVRVKLNWWNKAKLVFMSAVSLILWLVLFFTGVNLVWYYGSTVWTKGFFDQETLKYAVLLIVGAYACLILDKSKIYEALNIKRDLPFITIEQTEKKK